MEESFDHLLKESNAVASFPCHESAIRFVYYACIRGYRCEMSKHDDERQGYYRVKYWKEGDDE